MLTSTETISNRFGSTCVETENYSDIFSVEMKNILTFFSQMVASLWSALPLTERAKYQRKAEQNMQHVQTVQTASEVENVQNYGREVEEEWRGGQSQSGGKLEERVGERKDKRPAGEGDNFCKASPVSSPAPPPPPASSPTTPPAPAPASPALPAISSPAKDLTGDSQPYCIFYSELRQVIGS